MKKPNREHSQSLRFKQSADGSWESYRVESAVAPDTKRPAFVPALSAGNTSTGKPEGESKAGAALTQGALRNMNKAALESLAVRHGVDLTGLSNNKKRADKIFEHIESKRGS